MKSTLLTVILSLTIGISFAQNFTELSRYEFQDEESYKSEEKNVLLCADFLLNNPADQALGNRHTSVQYILKWMTGTPDYTFDLDNRVMELTKGNDDLLALYMAAMTKVVLENSGPDLTAEQIYKSSENLLVAYCANGDNRMKPSRKIKKLLKAEKR